MNEWTIEDWTVIWAGVGAVGQWFAGFATLAAVIYLFYGDYLKRPVLICNFDNKMDVKTQYSTPGVEPASRASRWLRVRGQNKGSKDCQELQGLLDSD